MITTLAECIAHFLLEVVHQYIQSPVKDIMVRIRTNTPHWQFILLVSMMMHLQPIRSIVE